jgi:uncharacterized protein
LSIGLIALLDDIAGLAKIAAASIDDVAGQAAKAGVKAAGVVIDDAAVTPRYVVGFTAARELPIVGKIAVGSVKNKLLFLLPAALLLSFFAPWAITPLLMIGGAYLCFEGAEKIYESVQPHAQHGDEDGRPAATSAKELEEEKVAGAIKTDFILSAEIMAITLAAVPEGGVVTQAIVLAIVGIGITVAVYGGVALIVKADDVGLALARRTSGSILARLGRGLGRGLVRAMPIFLRILGIIGTAAMIWVGGGIIVHGLERYGVPAIADAIHHAADAVGEALPAMGGLTEWLVMASGSGLIGLLIGFALIPVAQSIVSPLWSKLFARG